MDAYDKDDVVRLFSSDATEMELTVTAPNGVKTIYPSSRSVRFPLTQVGTWSYSWANGVSGEVMAKVPRPESIDLIDELPAPQVAPGGVLRTSPI